MSTTNRPDAAAKQGFHEIAEAERLIEQAEQDPNAARLAAIAALRGLLLYWGEEPRGQTVRELLDQAARTDGTLADFQVPASDLDARSDEIDAVERAKIFLDAARGRLTGD
jgi:HEPN domain-containing protein